MVTMSTHMTITVDTMMITMEDITIMDMVMATVTALATMDTTGLIMVTATMDTTDMTRTISIMLLI